MNRLPLALFLSALVLIGWSFLARPPAQDEPAETRSVGAPVEAEARTSEPVPSAPGDAAVDASEDAVRAQTRSSAEPAAEAAPAGAEDESGVEEMHVVEVGTPGEAGCYHAVFSSRGGSLRELRLGDFYDRVGLEPEEQLDREHWTHLIDSVDVSEGETASLVLRTSRSSEPLVTGPLAEANWNMTPIERGVEFELEQDTGIVFRKRVRFREGTHELLLDLELENRGYAAPGQASFFFTPAEVVPPESDEKFYIEPQAVAAGRTARAAGRRDPGLPEIETVPKRDKPARGAFDIPTEVMSFAGVHNKYFAFLMHAADQSSSGSMRGAEWRSVFDADWAERNPAKADKAWRYMATDVLLELTVPPVGQTSKASYVIYAGPKERDAIQAEFADHEALLREDVDSWLPGDESVATLLIGVLKLLERLTGNWGLAIILMTILIRLVLFPLNRRSQTAMARYQAVVKRMQPRIDELKKKHEKEPDKLRRAQAELMQKEGAMPPLGGCLPIFVQLPVFFGLFTAVRTSFDLRQQPFVGWITDLSKPDRLMRLDLDTGLPLIGTIEYLNVLPPLMVALWIGQQMVMPKPSDEQARQMQRMMMFMPLVMGVFLYNYASGLSLYMITQSVLGIVEIGVIKRVWPVDDTPQPRKQGGFLARLAEKQQQQMKRMEEMKRQQSATRSQAARTRKRKKNRR